MTVSLQTLSFMTAWDDESVEEACDEAVPAGPELALLGPPTTPPPELVGPPPAVVAAAAAVAAMDQVRSPTQLLFSFYKDQCKMCGFFTTKHSGLSQLFLTGLSFFIG